MIKDIIEKLLLDNWDWLAFIIAIGSLIYAVKTFKSQKQTADNTTPTINEDIQKFLLQKMFVNLLDAYTNIVVHERIIEENINLNRSEEITANQVIPENMIHLELFYGQNNEGHKDDELFQKTKKKFQKLNALDESIRNYNMNLVILRGLIHDKIFDSNMDKTKEVSEESDGVDYKLNMGETQEVPTALAVKKESFIIRIINKIKELFHIG